MGDTDELADRTLEAEHADQFGWAPEPGEHIPCGMQEDFWQMEVKPKLAWRQRRPCQTVGESQLNGGFTHRPKEPGLAGAPVMASSYCVVPVYVHAPTLFYQQVLMTACDDCGQAPCPDGGFKHATMHKTWTSRRAFVDDRWFGLAQGESVTK